MAEIGKTTFAVHAADLLTGAFPDGAVLLAAARSRPGQEPVDPAGALDSLLLTAGVPAAAIPPGHIFHQHGQRAEVIARFLNLEL